VPAGRVYSQLASICVDEQEILMYGGRNKGTWGFFGGKKEIECCLGLDGRATLK
jgi:hypothetical protein